MKANAAIERPFDHWAVLHQLDQSDAEEKFYGKRQILREPEVSLMEAMFWDAYRCLAGHGTVGLTEKMQEQVIWDTVWVLLIDPDWEFSFDNVCEHIGLCAERVRAHWVKQFGLKWPAELPEIPVWPKHRGRPPKVDGVSVENHD